MQQQLFDYGELAQEDRAYVKHRELLIRETAKQTAQGIVNIGQLLSEAKERLEHGKWLPWLKLSFGWSRQSAVRFIQVYELSKCQNFGHLEIDVSALYLIAAPATPEPVVAEVIKRAKAGEPMTRAKAVEVLKSYRARVALPPPSVARQIAIATGVPTVASTNTFVLPMSAEAERALSDEQHLIRSLYNSITAVAEMAVSPADMVVLGEKHACRELAVRTARAAKWLTAVVEEVERQVSQRCMKRIEV